MHAAVNVIKRNGQLACDWHKTMLVKKSSDSTVYRKVHQTFIACTFVHLTRAEAIIIRNLKKTYRMNK